MASSVKLPTQAEIKEAGTAAWEILKDTFATLRAAGLFKLDHAKSFAVELALPFDSQNFSVSALQGLLLANTADVAELIRRFTIMNGVAFYLEVLGDITALLLNRPLPLFIFQIVYAIFVAYVLYWLVVKANANAYVLVAIGLYVVYSIINTIQAVVTLGLIVPAFFYMCKTVASLCCAYYAFKLEKLGKFERLHDEEDYGVAE